MILAVLQARMSSTRLPGKVMMPLAGAPMIVRQIERVARARRIDKLVVATSTDPSDDILEATVRREAIEVFRGPLEDVQARYIAALDAHPADHVVRLTGDCPLADPHVIDATINHVLAYDADYGSNTPPHRTFPKGLDVEVMTAKALREAAADPSDEARQHVTWDLHRGGERWKQAFLSQAAHDGEVRWTVDRPDDYAFVAAVYDALYPTDRAFTSNAVRAFVRSRAELGQFGGDRRV
jgi:spore coat polysaccharide biosynthesis protein SpsF